MEPKDMTNEELLRIIAQIGYKLGDDKKTNGEALDCFSEAQKELLRRMDASAALRKENAELRKHLERIVDAFSEEAQDRLCDLVMYAADWLGTHPDIGDATKARGKRVYHSFGPTA